MNYNVLQDELQSSGHDVMEKFEDVCTLRQIQN